MTKKILFLLALCCLILASCAKQGKPYISEVKSKTVEARAGQEFEQYAVYSPELTAKVGIEFEDIDYAVGTYRLINPTLDKLKSLSENDMVTLYYNQIGQVFIEIKVR